MYVNVGTGRVDPSIVRVFEDYVNEQLATEEGNPTIEERTTSFECSWDIEVRGTPTTIPCDESFDNGYTKHGYYFSNGPGVGIDRLSDISEENRVSFDRAEDVESSAHFVWSISARISNTKYTWTIADLEIPVITSEYANNRGGIYGAVSNDDRCRQAP